MELVLDFYDHFDFHGHTRGQGAHAYCRTRVTTSVAVEGNQQIGSTVGYAWGVTENRARS